MTYMTILACLNSLEVIYEDLKPLKRTENHEFQQMQSNKVNFHALVARIHK